MNDCTSLIAGETLPTWEYLRPAIQVAGEQRAAAVQSVVSTTSLPDSLLLAGLEHKTLI